MCGIVGYVGPKPVLPVIMDGLRRLEYRGYDSAGLAVVRDGADRSAAQRRQARASRGRARQADRSTGDSASATRAGRRTAGPPRRTRTRIACPAIAVVHNGIIENHLELRRELSAEGHKFVTETDTEIVAHLVETRDERDDGLAARGATGARARARALRAGGGLGGRARDDRRRAQRPAAGHRPRRGRVLCRQRHAGDPRATRATWCSSTTARWPSSRAAASSSRLRRPAASRARRGASTGTRDGREGRLQALHAQGDPRAAAGGRGHAASAASRSTRATSSSTRCSSTTAALDERRARRLIACGTTLARGDRRQFLIEQLARLPVDVDSARSSATAIRSSAKRRSSSR